MSFIFSISILFIFWSVLYLLNTFLLEWAFTSAIYAKFLSKNGLSVNIFHLKWYTVRCNRLFIKLSNWKPKLLKWWFNFGVVAGVIGQFLSILVLLYNLFDFFRNKSIRNESVLVPVLPGVNLPSDQTVYYFLALFICGLVHELGHAVAASTEQVRVNGFGIFITFIFPGAFVDLCSDHLQVISPLRQLRIFCAGVWHNFIIVLLAIAFIQVHPIFVKNFFDNKVNINYVADDSPLKSIVKPNEVIINAANCKVSNSFSFYECLYKFDQNPNNFGYCLSSTEVDDLSSTLTEYKTNLNECCMLNATYRNYCFKWSTSHSNLHSYACLPARLVTDKATCREASDCDSNLSLCVKPVWENSTKLIRIVFESEKPLLYVGSVKELIYSIQIEEYVPKFIFIPKFLNLQLLLFLKYLVAFSGAIGLLNLVPCFALDGQYILAALLSVNKRKSGQFINENETKRPILYILIMTFGTVLLSVNLICSIFNLISSKIGSFFLHD